MVTIRYFLSAIKNIANIRTVLLNNLERFLLGIELEPQMVFTDLSDEELCEKSDFDLLVVQHEDRICIYGSMTNYHTQQIREFLDGHNKKDICVDFYSLNEEMDYEG